jgi:hypothetical protein
VVAKVALDWKKHPSLMQGARLINIHVFPDCYFAAMDSKILLGLMVVAWLPEFYAFVHM